MPPSGTHSRALAAPSATHRLARMTTPCPGRPCLLSSPPSTRPTRLRTSPPSLMRAPSLPASRRTFAASPESMASSPSSALGQTDRFATSSPPSVFGAAHRYHQDALEHQRPHQHQDPRPLPPDDGTPPALGHRRLGQDRLEMARRRRGLEHSPRWLPSLEGAHLLRRLLQPWQVRLPDGHQDVARRPPACQKPRRSTRQGCEYNLPLLLLASSVAHAYTTASPSDRYHSSRLPTPRKTSTRRSGRSFERLVTQFATSRPAHTTTLRLGSTCPPDSPTCPRGIFP